MKPYPILFAVGLLGGCATPLGAAIAPEGNKVPLNQAVHVGALVATPRAVVEDSRCPINARCVWAGRLVVSTRIDGPGWHEAVPLTLGAPYATHGTTIALVSGTPAKRTERTTAPADYRFSFEAER
ncbi:MAG: hypothetical protein ABIT09_04295 [Croceibacterium sp.]